ncbi:iron chelate uptake ABC transporter family permease subunit [Hansschlegelia plantiphila]|uniref:Enterobactin ABC transporter permease n=1 Tax=Hansschlegelia plantiphila TaxID=374655 RepID=A0A9W6J1L7_9HYPH|nr:iron chelate uptake ABC transporter family permease subunit [Hansschlegelia plantiphila]GLK69062.1 enterobactin ABC transporter permease [Hansschlegelia plantiphila]
MRDHTRTRPAAVLAVLAIAAIISALAYMTIGARGPWSFILPFRGAKLAALVLVATAVAVSTVTFQTIANNRILTPSLMGFDALYALIRTATLFLLGAGGFAALDPRLAFAVNVVLMTGFASLLYRWLLTDRAEGLHLLLLVGVIAGVFFRSLSNFMHRLVDPTDFLVLQGSLFANFNAVDGRLLAVSAVLVAGAGVALWRLVPKLDVLALGRDHAVNLGVDYRRTLTVALGLVAILVSVSTALVGPVTFFGLLVANLAYLAIPSHRHAMLLPAAALLAISMLVSGQIVLERVFGLDAALSMVIEFVGGVVFLVLLLRKTPR